MNPLLYTKPIIARHIGATRRCGYRKLWYSENQRVGSLALIHTGNSDTRIIPKPASPIFLGSYSVSVKQFRINNFHTSAIWRGQEPSSKVEETVKSIKEGKEEKEKEKLASVTSKDVAQSPEKSLAAKRTLWQKVKAEILHYYHGFRLLGLDMKVSAKLIWRILQGKELSRREHRLLVKTTGDMFRLIPFSVFIIVPFMEFLLPVVIKFFPGMLPSTFQTASDKEDKMKKAFKVKIEVAKFLQKTLDEMSVQSSDHRSEKAKEFSEFFYKVRSTGSIASNEEILKFSKLFEDEITLDSLSRQQLIALCRVIDVQTLGTTNFLRFLLRMRLRSLAADDRLIEKEGVESLTRAELQQACRARGMRAYGMPENKLREQLAQWLDLSLNKKVPPSLLLLSRALMVPEATPMSDKLKATISALPDDVVARTKGAIGEKEGKLDHRTNIEIIKIEEKRIEEERQEQQEKEQKEKEQKESEPQPTILATDTKSDEITKTDVQAIEQALDSIGKQDKKMIVEKEELKELKEEMAEYQEDIQELYKMKEESKGESEIEDIKVSKGAKRLFNKVNKMISKMDTVLSELEQSEKKIKEKVGSLPPEEKPHSKAAEELVKIDELIAAIKKYQNVPDEHRLTRIAEILGKIDDDRDGSIKIEDVLKVVELIGQEDIKLSKKHLNELIDLLEKEEVLEVEDQIQKALKKESKEADEITTAEKSIKDDSRSTVPATPVTVEKKFGKEELNEDAGVPEKNFSSPPSSSKLKTDSDSDPVRNPTLGPSVPPTPKKAEGSKHL